jgi:hypothetical protein
VIAHGTNRGHIATYNEGLGAVDGEYVVLLSADDLLSPGSLGRSTALLSRYPQIGLVYGFSPGFVDQPPVARTAVRSWSIWSGHDWIAQICRRVANPVATPEVVMRTSLMRELVGYDTRVPHSADMLLWLRAAARASIGRVNGADQAFYRKHGGNMHVERYAGVHTDITERLRTFDILFDDDGALFPPGHGLREVAREALAREALVTVCRSYESGVEAEPRDRLVELAEQLVPRSGEHRLWRGYESRLARARKGRAALPRRVGAVLDDVTGRIRWRRWRRDGLMGAVN